MTSIDLAVPLLLLIGMFDLTEAGWGRSAVAAVSTRAGGPAALWLNEVLPPSIRLTLAALLCCGGVGFRLLVDSGEAFSG